MELGCLIVCCCLLSQQSPPRTSGVPPARESTPSADLVPIEPRKSKLTPPRLVAESLVAPEEDPLSGRAIGLAEVLTRSATRPRQLAAVQAYWALAAAVGEYYYSRQEQEALEALAASIARGRAPTSRQETPDLAAETALASARVKEAELRAIAAQVELAERLGLPAADRWPLPADPPHTGGYATKFEHFFANRVAPPRMQLIERVLPLRCKAIDARAEAVQAASDSLAAAQDALKHGHADAAQVADRIAHLGRQRRAFLDAVRLYNSEIVEYALGVAHANASPADIERMLIERKAAAPAAERANTTSVQQPIRGAAADAAPTSRGTRSLLKTNPPAPNEPQETRLKPLASDDQLAQATTADADSPDYESYAALLSLTPPKRTHRLARLLHWDRSAPDGAQPPLTFAQCLAMAPPAERRRAIELYWITREQAARCQVSADQNDQFAALYPITLQAVRRSGGDEAMLHLRAQQQAAQADLYDSRALLWQKRLDLATILGRSAQLKDWPMPTTPPHGGRYETKIDAQPQTLAHSSVVQRLATTVPGLYAPLEDRAQAIVLLDKRRADAIEEFVALQQRVDLWNPLTLVTQQAAESLAFLATLTQYNLSIADYALAILPANVSPPELAASLVVQAN